MPGMAEDETYTRRLRQIRKAWIAHYVAKGCSEDKAWSLARRKTHTWP